MLKFFVLLYPLLIASFMIRTIPFSGPLALSPLSLSLTLGGHYQYQHLGIKSTNSYIAYCFFLAQADLNLPEIVNLVWLFILTNNYWLACYCRHFLFSEPLASPFRWSFRAHPRYPSYSLARYLSPTSAIRQLYWPFHFRHTRLHKVSSVKHALECEHS